MEQKVIWVQIPGREQEPVPFAENETVYQFKQKVKERLGLPKEIDLYLFKSKGVGSRQSEPIKAAVKMSDLREAQNPDTPLWTQHFGKSSLAIDMPLRCITERSLI
ncbi:MAG: ubiquitin-like domain-containing protein, partial [bacterium]